jgi:hypothetical protein
MTGTEDLALAADGVAGMTTHDLDSARSLIERGDIRWFDFCADRGHLPGNVDHLKCIQREFVIYINEET